MPKSRMIRRNPITMAAARIVVEALEVRRFMSTSWFVAPNGSDSGAGTIGSPFQTIQRAASIAGPGDTVMIRGGIYHETVAPSHSGTSSAPITFQAYNNESVTVDGADPISNWSNTNGSIYHATDTVNLGVGYNQVFVDGQAINEARYPNTSLDPSHPTLATAQSVSVGSNTATIFDSSLWQPNGYWNGAMIHFNPGQQWVAYTATVTNSGPGFVTFAYTAPLSAAVVNAGTQYYLLGKFQALDANGEFYLDPSSNQLYAATPNGDNPVNHLVEAKHRQFAFDLSGDSNVIVRGINIFAATINTNSQSTNDVFDHISAKYLSQFVYQPDGWNQPANGGILLSGAGDVLENSTIAYSSGDGVLINANFVRVTNNVIHDVDYNAGDSAAVVNYAWQTSIDHNTIYNTGRNAINAFGGDVQILRNVIYYATLQTTDGGGIYTARTDGSGTHIEYNAVFGTHSGGFGSSGIYLDNDSYNFTVDHNITTDIDYAIKLNNSSHNENIFNNTFDASQFSLGVGGTGSDWSGTSLTYNIFTRTMQTGESNAYFANNINPGTNPGFTNGPGGDFTLRWWSPAAPLGAGAIPYGQPSFPAGANLDWTPAPPVWQAPPASVPPTPPPAVGTPATSVIQAESFSAQQGIQLLPPGIGYFDNGDWMQYKQINFGNGVSTLTFSLAVPAQYAGQTVQVRIDGVNGPVIASLKTQATSSWSDYQLQFTSVSSVTGVHDLYLVGVGSFGVGNIDWFQFS